MKLTDAPPAGWYPDPEGGSRLRWWEGTDWSDRYRARPPEMREVPAGQMSMSNSAGAGWSGQIPPISPGMARPPGHVDSAQIVEQVRQAARQEAQRASELFGQQARAATRNIAPLITEYTTKVTRVLRFLAVAAIVLLIGWVVFEVFAQQSLFDWVGDRIDNLTAENASGAARAIERWPR